MSVTVPRRLAAGALAGVLVAALAGGCSSASDGADPSTPTSSPPSASPSPSPTVDEAAALKAANIETAKQVVVDYLHAFNEVHAAGAQGWEVLLPYWGGDYRELMVRTFQGWAEEGKRTEGFAEVTSQEVVEYTPSSGEKETVTLDACVDFSGVRAFDADGSEIDHSGNNRRFVNRYVVQREQGDYWTIHDEDPAPEEPC